MNVIKLHDEASRFTKNTNHFFFSFSESNSGAVSHRIYTDTQTYIHTPFDVLSGIWTVNGVIGFYNLVDITCTMSRFAPLQYCIFFFKLMNLLVAPNLLKKLTNYRHHIQAMVKFGHFIGCKCSSSKKAIELKMLTFSRICVQFNSFIHPSVHPLVHHLQLKIFIEIVAPIEMVSIFENTLI